MTGATQLGFIHRFEPGRDFTLLLLHGTGGDENDLIPLGRALAPEAALLSPRGTVLENGMPRFFRRLAEGVFDIPDLIFRTRELAAFVQAASGHYGFPRERVLALGYSNGANIAASLLLLEPERLAGAMLFRPMVPLEPDRVPDLGRKPVFIGAGRRDPFVPPRESERLAALLRGVGADVTLHWSSDGHALEGAELDAAREWLARSAS